MIRTVGARELDALAKDGSVDIVDVRDAQEWRTGHVPGARHVPLEELRADPERALPRDKVVFVCAKGSRSQIAAKIAERRGLAEIYSLDGGTRAWQEAGLPIVVPAVVVPVAAPVIAPVIAPVVAPVITPGAAPKEAVAPKPVAAPPAIEPAAPDDHDPPEPILDAIVGANLREQRARRGLTLDALAKLAGVSRSLLGQAELGRSLPSLNVLWKLAVALNVPFATLVATAPRQGTVVLRRAKAQQIVNSEGRFGTRALFPPTEKGGVEFYELWLAPHSREEADAHQPGTRENLVVNSGTLDLDIAGSKIRLEAGDAVLFAADVPHTYINPSSNECWMHLVMTYAPS